MILKKSKDVPEEISKTNLTDWYNSLNDQQKVKLGRYLGGSDVSSKFALCISIMRKANEENNHSVTILVGENIIGSKISDMERFETLEEMIPAYFEAKRYDECLKCCEEGLALIPELLPAIRKSDGTIPERLMCRNYLINVLVGAYGDYDAGDEALDRLFEMGLISEEDVKFRKQSHKIHKLQRTFDGIYGVKLKDQ